ncbi:MAG TPA: ribonuclease E/G, partial [Acetobacteraceae bacterium]|nr:ribonuclease E/G [Acetobacteraceae bacterium]
NRPKPEIKRDCEYLLRLWDDIREHTMRSVAPALIYEEASLIKRAIRDVYSRDIDEITVDGEAGWRAARDFMRMLMPSHVKKVQLWRDPGASAASAVASLVGGQPLFSRHQVDAQLDAVLSPTVQLRSGGYLVINQAEALVAIDVNSGRSTRERGIEETALRTNLEAADEVARQLRLRDLAGLIVIDFIDMESKKHNAMVERRLKDALKTDRARIQVGHISHFGLLEMSRQRLRPSLAETSFVLCAHCGGTGHVRSTESAAIHVLRGIEEEAAKHRAAEVLVHAATSIEMYIFNHKRDRLAEIETRYGMRVAFAADDALISPQFRIERLRVQTTPEAPVAITAGPGHALPPLAEPEEPADDAAAIVTDDTIEPVAAASDQEVGQPPSEAGDEASAAESAEEAERHRRRRRRRRRGGRRDEAPATGEAPAMPTDQDMPEAHLEGVPEHADPAASDDEGARRRGRRGRRRRRDGETLPEIAAPGAEQPELLHTGPTPANPFGSHGFDIFDVLEQAEQRSAGPPASVLPVIARPPIAASVPAESVPAESVPAESMSAGAAADIEPEPAGFDDAPFELPPASAVPGAPPTADELPDLQPEPPDAAIAPEPAPSAPTATEPEPPAPANDREPEPTVRPIVIGVEDEPAAEKKRGWWRR